MRPLFIPDASVRVLSAKFDVLDLLMYSHWCCIIFFCSPGCCG